MAGRKVTDYAGVGLVLEDRVVGLCGSRYCGLV